MEAGPQMQNLSEFDAAFELLGKILPDFVARYDQLGRIRYMNPSLLNVLHIELSDVAGKTPDHAWPDGRFSELQRKIMECLASGQVCSLDMTVNYGPARTEYHNVRLVCEQSETGEYTGVLALGRNMTDRFLMEGNLAAASRLKALGQIASGVCHEVNNPLAIIAACSKRVNLLAQKTQPFDQDLMKTAHWIDQAVARIAQIVQSLQILSHEDRLPSSEPFSAVSMIQGALAFFREKFKKHCIDLIEDTSSDGDVLLSGSRSQWTRALYNLLSNSYDAVCEARCAWIKVSLRHHEDHMEVRVIDSGPRLERDIIQNLMQPFFTTKAQGQGAGLGLSVARAIAEAHGGKLFYDADSEWNCFVLELPMPAPKFLPPKPHRDPKSPHVSGPDEFQCATRPHASHGDCS